MTKKRKIRTSRKGREKKRAMEPVRNEKECGEQEEERNELPTNEGSSKSIIRHTDANCAEIAVQTRTVQRSFPISTMDLDVDIKPIVPDDDSDVRVEKEKREELDVDIKPAAFVEDVVVKEEERNKLPTDGGRSAESVMCPGDENCAESERRFPNKRQMMMERNLKNRIEIQTSVEHDGDELRLRVLTIARLFQRPFVALDFLKEYKRCFRCSDIPTELLGQGRLELCKFFKYFDEIRPYSPCTYVYVGRDAFDGFILIDDVASMQKNVTSLMSEVKKSLNTVAIWSAYRKKFGEPTALQELKRDEFRFQQFLLIHPNLKHMKRRKKLVFSLRRVPSSKEASEVASPSGESVEEGGESTPHVKEVMLEVQLVGTVLSVDVVENNKGTKLIRRFREFVKMKDARTAVVVKSITPASTLVCPLHPCHWKKLVACIRDLHPVECWAINCEMVPDLEQLTSLIEALTGELPFTIDYLREPEFDKVHSICTNVVDWRSVVSHGGRRIFASFKFPIVIFTFTCPKVLLSLHSYALDVLSYIIKIWRQGIIALTFRSFPSDAPENMVDDYFRQIDVYGKKNVNGCQYTLEKKNGSCLRIFYCRSGSALQIEHTPAVTAVSSTVKAHQCIMKKQLPCTAQGFVQRPDLSVYNSNMKAKKIIVEANYFKMDHQSSNAFIYQYNIQFMKKGQRPGPDLEMKKREEASTIFWTVVNDNRKFFPNPSKFAYNGVNMLYSTEQLRLRGCVEKTFPVCPTPRDTIFVNIKFAKALRLNSISPDVAQQTELVSILDEAICARIRNQTNSASKRFPQDGRSTFFVPDRSMEWDKRMAIPIGMGFEAWTGLHTAVKPSCQLGMLLNVDLDYSIFYKQECQLVYFLMETLGRCNWDDKNEREREQLLRSQLEDGRLRRSTREHFEAALKGIKLTYSIPTNCKEVFEFSALTNKSAIDHVLEGGQCSVAEYYQRQYGIDLQFPYLPCLQLCKTKKTVVPMEMVYTSSDPKKFRGQIPDTCLKKMIQACAFAPPERRDIILSMAASDGTVPNKPVFLASQDEHMENFGVSVDRQFVKVGATILPEPALEFGPGRDGKPTTVRLNHEGVWDLADPANNTMKKARIRDIVSVVPSLIFIGGEDTEIDVPLGTLLETLENFGVNLPCKRHVFVRRIFRENDSWPLVSNWMYLFKESVASKYHGAIPLAIFVLPYKCTSRRQGASGDYFSEYAMIKYICDIEVGVHAQCILSKTFGQMHGNPLTCTTAHNMAIKILAKIGVPLYQLERNGPHKDWTLLTDHDKPTLILAINVSHPEILKGGYTDFSIGCVVGNIDLDCSIYEPSVNAQITGEERTLSIEDEVSRRIKRFTEYTGKHPHHIVVYRDGVSESQFREVLHAEKMAIQTACQLLEPNYNPTLTYIVMNKRHHTRFFATDRADTHEKACNLQPGTLVDTGIVNREMFDFFLISQFGPLGTSRPAHYTVLYDEWQPSPLFWQTVTHCLTYNYLGCNKSISQPSPVMYAHLAAKRAKDYLMAYFYINGPQLRGMSLYMKNIEVRREMKAVPGVSGMTFV